MSRRSARLLTGGYYSPDEDSETSISCAEIPLKVFNKRRTGGQRTGSACVSPGSINPFSKTPITNDFPAMVKANTGEGRTTFVVPQYPVRAAPPAPVGPSRFTPGPCCHDKFSLSGYSSETEYTQNGTAAATTACSSRFSSLAPFANAFPASWNVSPHTLKVTLKMISLLMLTCGVGFGLLTSLSYLTSAKTPAATDTLARPLSPLRPMAGDTDYASLENKINHMMIEIQQKQEKAFSQLEQQLTDDLKDVQNRMENLDKVGKIRIEQDIADLRSNFRVTTSILRRKVEAQELQTNELQHKMSAAPHSPISHVTPELERALKKWLNDNIPMIEPLHDKLPDPNKMADFALESQGAFVMKASESYHHQSACFSLFGIPLWYKTETPRTVLQGNPPLAGRCWPLKGDQGSLTVCLSHPVRISHVTVDHLPQENNPTGRTTSAPQDFDVYGMNSTDGEGTLLGSFRYESNGEPTQTFETPSDGAQSTVYKCVELRILSNWGQPAYTCLYRFRVHGQASSVV